MTILFHYNVIFMTQFADSPEVIESKEETEDVTQEKQETEEVKGEKEEEQGKNNRRGSPVVNKPSPD